MALPKQKRIKKKKDFDRVFKRGASLRNDFFLMKLARNDLLFSRAAIVVPVSISSKAADRNRIKRMIATALEKFFSRSEFNKNRIDIVLIAQVGVKEKDFKEIYSSLGNIFKKANIV